MSQHERALGPLQVGLRKDLHFTRQESRGGPRYLVHDPITFQNHAFGILDYRILTAIVRQRTLAQTFRLLVRKGQLDDEDKEGFYRFVLWLHGIGLLQLPITRSDVLYDRHIRKQRAQRPSWRQVFMNYKVPVFDPDQFLQKTIGYVGWLFSGKGLALWIGLMLAVVWKCAGRFDELFAQSSDLLALANLPVLWLALVVLKVIHEFGHAYACRKFGGAVPEMGVVFILMTPCAYVDASASWKFARRRQRVAVALGGMYVESIIAGLAALVWAGTEPGFVHDVAFNVVALASVVTVLFNLNPLMKFDGYYLFSDLAGVFNLQPRASRFLKGWLGRLVLGWSRPQHGHTTSECLLYGLYGPSAFLYRVFLAFAITSLVMMQWPGAGLFLGAIFVWSLMLQPVLRVLRYLWKSEETESVRTRARLVAMGAVGLAPLVLALLPVSSSVIAPGILDPRMRESVRAPVGGFITDITVENGAHIQPGDALCVLRNPELEMRRLRMAGELEAEQISLDAVELDDATRASIHRARLSYLRAGVAEIDSRLASMRLKANLGGTLAAAQDLDLEGRFLQQGEELFQIQSDHKFLRIVLTDHALSRARLEIGSEAEVRWTCAPDPPVRAVVREIRRSASRFEIPVALTMLAGGDVYALPTGASGALADRPYLHVFLEVETVPLIAQGAGLTARVRLPARVEVLGAWARRRLLSFWNSWRMS